jgi:hypothetical protein
MSNKSNYFPNRDKRLLNRISNLCCGPKYICNDEAKYNFHLTFK